MIEVDCRICKNCTGFSCEIYGSNADKAVKNCANDNFINYKKKNIWRENEDDWFKWYECKTCGYILGLVCDYPKYKLPTKCPECERGKKND